MLKPFVLSWLKRLAAPSLQIKKKKKEKKQTKTNGKLKVGPNWTPGPQGLLEKSQEDKLAMS